jgi:hypothetical protein
VVRPGPQGIGLAPVTTPQHWAGIAIGIPASIGRPLVGPSDVPLEWEPLPENSDVAQLATHRYALLPQLAQPAQAATLAQEAEGVLGSWWDQRGTRMVVSPAVSENIFNDGRPRPPPNNTSMVNTPPGQHATPPPPGGLKL